MKQPKIICLCGSTKFKEQYREQEARFALEGVIILSCGLFSHAEDIKLTNVQKLNLDRLHFAKIDLADEIFVINKNGYIGESTQNEIDYARSQNTKVTFLEPNHEQA